MILFSLIIIFIITFISLCPIYKKPLYNDDGAFLYYPKFTKKNITYYNFNDLEHDGPSFMFGGMEHIFLFVSQLFKKDSINFFRTIQLSWLACINVSLFYYIFILSDNYYASYLSSFFLLLAYLSPKNNFYILLGETYYLLQFLLMNIFVQYFIITDNYLFLLFSGILACWMMLSKIVALPIVIFYFLVSFVLDFYMGWVYFLFGLVVPLILVNLYLLLFKSRYSMYYYNRAYWHPLIIKIAVLRKKKSSSETLSYVEKMHYGTNKQVKDLKLKNTKVFIEEYRSILLLAGVSFIYVCLNPNWLFVLHFINFLIFISILKIQNFYFITKFNPIILPLIIVISLTFADFLSSYNSIKLYSSFILIIIICNIELLIKGFSQFKKQNISKILGFKHFGEVNRLAKEIGIYIKNQNNSSKERMLVWGNLPNINIYADLPQVLGSFTFIYPARVRITKRREDVLMKYCKKYIPKFVVQANYFVNDAWSIDEFSIKTGIPYKLLKDFSLKKNGSIQKNSSGNYFYFPVYKRDDEIYGQVFIEKIISEDFLEYYDLMQLYKYRSNYWSKEYKNDHILFPQYDKYQKNGLKGYLIEKTEAYLENKNIILFLISLINLNIPDKIHQINSQLAQVTDKEKAILYYVKAKFLIEIENIKEAKDLLIKSIDMCCTNFYPYIRLGEVYFLEGDIAGAYDSFLKALDINNLSTEAHNNIGFVYAQIGDIFKAKEHLLRALEINPNYTEAINNLEYVMKEEMNKSFKNKVKG